jgi:hypothetical protein
MSIGLFIVFAERRMNKSWKLCNAVIIIEASKIERGRWVDTQQPHPLASAWPILSIPIADREADQHTNDHQRRDCYDEGCAVSHYTHSCAALAIRARYLFTTHSASIRTATSRVCWRFLAAVICASILSMSSDKLSVACAIGLTPLAWVRARSMGHIGSGSLYSSVIAGLVVRLCCARH